jgi:septum formation protein
VPFTIRASHIAEIHPAGPPAEAVAAVALAKARAVADQLADELPPPWVVLGADTEVVIDGMLLGKPADHADAMRMLGRLRGRVHEVVTGVAVVVTADGRRQELVEAVVSRVTMTGYSEADVATYVATGEPMDKAGAYAVQGLGGRLVAGVDGCYTNVVGLPLTTTRRLLQRCDVL